MTPGATGHEEHVPGVRHGAALHPRHVPRPGARHLHRHRPHLPQVEAGDSPHDLLDDDDDDHNQVEANAGDS